MSGSERYRDYCARRMDGASSKVARTAMQLPASTATRYERAFQAGAAEPMPMKAEKHGPATLAGRAPTRGPAAREPGQPRCEVCLEPAKLERGRCKDRAACEARAPSLFPGFEA